MNMITQESFNHPVIFTLDELSALVDTFINYLSERKINIITFTGPLGAGKTTFIREFVRHIGVTELVTSPTFTYVNIYHPMLVPNTLNILALERIFHFDVYRLTSVNEFLEQGFDEYLAVPESLSIIEWPAVIDPLLRSRNDVCHVTLAYVDEMRREITIS